MVDERFELRLDHRLGGYCIVGAYPTRRAAIARSADFLADPEFTTFRVVDKKDAAEVAKGICCLFPRVPPPAEDEKKSPPKRGKPRERGT